MNALALGHPMINTIVAKPPHYTQGFYRIGSGPEHVLILGSCRTVPYANYFHYLNAGNRWTINLIDVVNFYFDAHDNRVDQEQVLLAYEQKPEMLEMLAKVKWFIHEHTANFGMLNTDRSQPKHIWQFGLKPEVEISLPNFNDLFILFQEQVDFDSEIRELARKDTVESGALSHVTKAKATAQGMARVYKFLEFCRQSSLPELEQIIYETWRYKRYWWTGSHISNEFTVLAFRCMCQQFCLHPSPGFWDKVQSEDLYAFPRSPITQYDVDCYGLQWPQPVEPLKIP